MRRMVVEAKLNESPGCLSRFVEALSFVKISADARRRFENDFILFIKAHYAKKIQRKWRSIKLKRVVSAVVQKARKAQEFERQGKAWKTEVDMINELVAR